MLNWRHVPSRGVRHGTLSQGFQVENVEKRSQRHVWMGNIWLLKLFTFVGRFFPSWHAKSSKETSKKHPKTNENHEVFRPFPMGSSKSPSLARPVCGGEPTDTTPNHNHVEIRRARGLGMYCLYIILFIHIHVYIFLNIYA